LYEFSVPGARGETRYFLVLVVDYSHFPFAFYCQDMTTKTVISCLSTLFVMFGFPCYIHSERGRSIASKDVVNFLHSKGISTSTQAVQSMRRLMGLTLEDNRVDGLFFCSTLTGRIRVHTHLCKQDWKRRTPVRRRLSRTHVLLGRVIPSGFVPLSEMKVRILIRLSNHSGYIGDPSSAPHLQGMLLSDELMSCCAASINGCLDLRRRAFALGGQVSADRGRCPGLIPLRDRDSVAPLRRSSAGRMPARIGRLTAGVGRRHSVTIRKASLMARSMRRFECDIIQERSDTIQERSTATPYRSAVFCC